MKIERTLIITATLSPKSKEKKQPKLMPTKRGSVFFFNNVFNVQQYATAIIPVNLNPA
jgi:hypothetical protein